MAFEAREELARMLAHAGPATSDSATVRVPAECLQLEVEGVGKVPLPIRAADVKKLVAVAGPAHVGKGEETLLDPSVRDTWQIPPERVSLGGDRWQASLADALARLGARLGIPVPGRLRAELHAMLVYGKGQFFAAHQDSEKHDDMVATLAVALPSHHTGGELVVHGREGPTRYPGSRDDLSLVVFRPDRHHEVLPVRSGHRVTLTFNVLLDHVPEAEVTGPADRAAVLLEEHFSTPVPTIFGARGPTPSRLAFLLDHEYTRRGLEAGRLKGEDAHRAALLVAAAEAAGCECVLAQTEIQETWDAQASDPYHGGDRYIFHEDEDEDEDEGFLDEEDVEVDELIDSTVVLTWWADPGNVRETDLPLGREEVCAATPSSDLVPYTSEHEGYMGNYGNTMDRWYRRAALVVWPQGRGFEVRARASPGWALRTILASLEGGDLERAREEAAGLAAAWGVGPSADLLGAALEVAAGVEDGTLASGVLAPFGMEQLAEEHADLLGRLARQYPEPWWTSLREQWDRGRGHLGHDRAGWVESTLVGLSRELRRADADVVARWLGSWVADWLLAAIAGHLRSTRVAQREDELARLGPPLAAVLAVVDEQEGTPVVDRLTAEGDVVLPLLLSAVRSHEVPADAAGLALSAHLRGRLEEHLARPLRPADDWSMAWASPGGEDADRLAEFLTSTGRRTWEWPLAAPRRQSIHRLIDDSGLPVTHVTRRKGSPYTLVLVKTDELFAGEMAARARAEEDLAMVRSVVQDEEKKE